MSARDERYAAIASCLESSDPIAALRRLGEVERAAYERRDPDRLAISDACHEARGEIRARHGLPLAS